MTTTINYTDAPQLSGSSLNVAVVDRNTGTLAVEWRNDNAYDKRVAYVYEGIDADAFLNGLKHAKSKGSFVSRFTAGHRSTGKVTEPRYKFVSQQQAPEKPLIDWEATLETAVGRLTVPIKALKGDNLTTVVQAHVKDVLKDGSYEIVGLVKK